MRVGSWRDGGVGRLLSLNMKQKAWQVVFGLAAHPVAASEPSCSLGPPRWQRSCERAAELRGGLKASRGGVLVFRPGANPVRCAGREGTRWFRSGLGVAAVLAVEAAAQQVCRRSVRRARPGKSTLREGVG
jgi:hypothetical protein